MRNFNRHVLIFICNQGLHRLEKYLNLEGFLEICWKCLNETFPLNFTNYYFMKNTIKKPAHEILVIITSVSSENSANFCICTVLSWPRLFAYTKCWSRWRLRSKLKSLANCLFSCACMCCENPSHPGYMQTCTLANCEDPDEMPHNAAFHQGLHCLLR